MMRFSRFLRRKQKPCSQPLRYYFNPDCIPGAIYGMMFCHLSGPDLKNCRLVCKTFERICSTYLNDKTCIIFDDTGGLGKILFSKTKTKQLLSYVQESDVKFSLWSSMRIRNTSENNIKTLLLRNVSDFIDTMQNVTKVEIIHSVLTLSTLIKFLSLFKNLEIYSDSQNSYFLMPESSLYCCQAYYDPEEKTLQEVSNYRIPAPTVLLSVNEPNFNLILMMKILEITFSNLQEFSLEIVSEKEVFPFERAEFSNNLGLFLLKNLGTLKTLTIRWAASNYHFFFEDFFHILPVLMTLPTREIFLTELCMDFDWIFIGHSAFETDLIPFVKRLRHLKKFTLMKVILQAGLGHLIEDIRPPPTCEFNLGILLSDHPNIDEAYMNRDALKGDVFLNSTTAMRVAIDLITTANVSQLIPLGQQVCMYMDDEIAYIQGCVKYPRTAELMIKHLWNGRSSNFISFNIHGVANSFPNLTELCLFDGPKFEYLGTFRLRRQWDYMSEAMIMDSDMQTIFKKLYKLKTVRIRACMNYLTDSGLTGLSAYKKEMCRSIISSPGFVASKNDILPNSVSNLKDLDEFILKGVGDSITDVSAYFGFNGLKRLRILAICGTSKISRTAKDYLKQSMAHMKDTRYEFT